MFTTFKLLFLFGLVCVYSAPNSTKFTPYFTAILEVCPKLRNFSTEDLPPIFDTCSNWQSINSKQFNHTKESVTCLMYFEAFTAYCKVNPNATAQDDHNIQKSLDEVCKDMAMIPKSTSQSALIRQILLKQRDCDRLCVSDVGWNKVKPVCLLAYYWATFANSHSAQITSEAAPREGAPIASDPAVVSADTAAIAPKPVPNVSLVAESNLNAPVVDAVPPKPFVNLSLPSEPKLNSPLLPIRPNVSTGVAAAQSAPVIKTEQSVEEPMIEETKPAQKPSQQVLASSSIANEPKIDKVASSTQKASSVFNNKPPFESSPNLYEEAKLDDDFQANPELPEKDNNEQQLVGDEEDDDINDEEINKSFNNPNAKPSSLDSVDSDMEGNSYFFTYFMILCTLFVVGYVCYHNKQKILALILEGRKGRRPYRGGRRPNSANYHKLDTNLEEAISSSCSKNATNVIY